MRARKRRWTVIGSLMALVFGLPVAAWLSLGYVPEFYRDVERLPTHQRREQAKQFFAQSMQLRNDIVNEPRWEAVFSAEEVNAWLAEDLMAYFADRVPAGIRDPRVAFDADRITLAFQFDDGPIHSVVWVVARVSVAEENVVALTVEKIRAGVLPIPAERLIAKLDQHAKANGLEIRWQTDHGQPQALLAYRTSSRRRDVVLEHLEVLDGRLRLAGRSQRGQTPIASPTLPEQRVLQSRFPKRKTQDDEPPAPISRRNTANPRI